MIKCLKFDGLYADVAQLAEQLFCKQQVVSPNLTDGSVSVKI